MKFLFLFLFFNTLVFSSSIIEIKISKIHGLVSFVNSLNGQGHIVKSYKTIYEENYKNKDIDKLKSILKKISKAEIYNYKDEKYLYNVIKQQSTFASNTSELRKIIFKYKTSLQEDDLQSYFTLLNKFLPIYENLIYNSSLVKLQNKKNELENLIHLHDFDNLIYKSAHFYGVKKEDISRIYLSLYPITRGRNTLAFMLGNVESIGVLINREKLNLEWLLSATVFHEITHTFYRQNYQNIKKLLYKNHFIKYKEQNAFNEAIATSFGAGWAFHEMTGLKSNGSWYNNKLYDEMAKKVYPLLSSYVNKSKEIDNEFVGKCYEFYNSIK